MPPATLDAFRDHGKVRASLEEDINGASRTLDRLERAGIDLDAITKTLVEEGVDLFKDAADKLLAAVATKRAAVLGPLLDRQRFALGPLAEDVKTLAETWRQDGTVRRLWARDKTVWTGRDEDKWLAWLDIVEREKGRLESYRALAEEVRREGFTDALVLGMGGSSLGPEVLAETFGRQPGMPRLRIVDSTDPAQIARTEAAVELPKTLFIVASKSGSTLEPNVFRDYFLARMKEVVGHEKAGRHFVAVTDPGSAMEEAARADGFRAIFHGEPQIGGRFSVLSAFGLVPAAVMGLDLGALLASAETMVRACGPDVPPEANPGVELGLALGAAAKAGRDKVTLIVDHDVEDFGAWAEQLLAESTGKNGLGLIPIAGEPLGPPAVYGQDRIFVHVRRDGQGDDAHDAALAALESAGHPVVEIGFAQPSDIVQEFYRFEFATAVAGAVIGIDAFDQPDVEASKVETRKLTDAYDRDGRLPAETAIWSGPGVELYTDPRNADALGLHDDLAGYLKVLLARATAGDYVALLAYLDRDEANQATLESARLAIRDGKRLATCLGFGPRFLHSTGQAYKGGPNSGVFLQITADPARDLPIPGRKATFGVVEAAQARGDFDVLAERGRRALRIHLKGGDIPGGLARLAGAVRKALG